MAWRACLRTNRAGAKLSSCLSSWKARRSKRPCVEQKPGFARARATGSSKLLSRRIEPRCPYFQRCGGCHYQHTGYEHQLEIKAAILKENLRRIAKLELDTELKVHPSPPWNYRNRTRLQSSQRSPVRAGILQIQFPRVAAGGRVSHQFAVDQSGDCCHVANGTQRRSSRPAIREIEFFANADDTQLLAEVYCGPEIARPQNHSPLNLRLRCRRSPVSYSSRLGATKVDVPGDPKQLAVSGAGHLIYADQICFLPGERWSVFSGQPPFGGRIGESDRRRRLVVDAALLAPHLISMLASDFSHPS